MDLVRHFDLLQVYGLPKQIWQWLISWCFPYTCHSDRPWLYVYLFIPHSQTDVTFCKGFTNSVCLLCLLIVNILKCYPTVLQVIVSVICTTMLNAQFSTVRNTCSVIISLLICFKLKILLFVYVLFL